jgi:serine/threonine protein kinase
MEQIESHVEFCALCQEVLEHLDDDEAEEIPGTTMPFLPGYRVYQHLGSGAFGEVWLAQDLNLPRVVAAKTFKVGASRNEGSRALEALRQDAHLLAQVEHPNIVRVYAWVTVHYHHYMIMQYVSGGSLDKLLKTVGPIEWQRSAGYIADVGEALLEVHARGIVHRDVKPANILWDPHRDEAVLTDFGVGAHISGPAGVAGSIPYMAPEVLDGQVSPALDVYSLAATFFHLVTNSPPFPSVKLANLKEQIRAGLPDPDPRCTGLPEPLERIIRDGLAADADRRPSLSDFVSRLRGALNQLIGDSFAMSHGPSSSLPSTELPPGAGSKPPRGPTTILDPPRPAPVDLLLTVSRHAGHDRFSPVAATHSRPAPGRLTRDMKKVPPSPDQVRLRTGDLVRVEVSTNRSGFLTVFNVGPTGSLNLLYPEADAQNPARQIAANVPLHILDVEMTPPAGRERLFAVWTRQSLVEPNTGASPVSRPYRATRDMKRVQQSVQQLPPEDWHAVVVELNHSERIESQGA